MTALDTATGVELIATSVGISKDVSPSGPPSATAMAITATGQITRRRAVPKTRRGSRSRTAPKFSRVPRTNSITGEATCERLVTA